MTAQPVKEALRFGEFFGMWETDRGWVVRTTPEFNIFLDLTTPEPMMRFTAGPHGNHQELGTLHRVLYAQSKACGLPAPVGNKTGPIVERQLENGKHQRFTRTRERQPCLSYPLLGFSLQWRILKRLGSLQEDINLYLTFLEIMHRSGVIWDEHPLSEIRIAENYLRAYRPDITGAQIRNGSCWPDCNQYLSDAVTALRKNLKTVGQEFPEILTKGRIA